MKPIAVVSDNWAGTIEWLKKTRKIVLMNVAQKILHDDADNTYVIINRKDEALGCEFSEVIVDPHYESLEKFCRIRIK